MCSICQFRTRAVPLVLLPIYLVKFQIFSHAFSSDDVSTIGHHVIFEHSVDKVKRSFSVQMFLAVSSSNMISLDLSLRQFQWNLPLLDATTTESHRV